MIKNCLGVTGFDVLGAQDNDQSPTSFGSGFDLGFE